MKRAVFKRVATAVAVGGMIFIFLFDIAAVLLSNRWQANYPVTPEAFDGGWGRTRIHFLNTGNSDCILLESAGRFALVDAGWGSDNPNKSAADREGSEARVLDYLKRAIADENGMVKLDFVLPTHYHYDHAGGFPLILADPAIQVGTVYLSPRDGQAHRHDLETRRRIEEISTARGFAIEEDIPIAPFQFGDVTLQFLNTEQGGRNENDNSIVTLLTYGDFRALLAADVTALHGHEQKLAREIGPVDLLKLPHHGYAMSSSAAFLRALRPKAAVVTNIYGKVYPNVMWNLAMVSRTALLSSVRDDGLIVTITDKGEIQATAHLQMEE